MRKRPQPNAPAAAPGATVPKDCDTCGAPPEAGLAACVYCRTAYPNVQAGVACPGCGAVNVRGQNVCVTCRRELTRPCLFCNVVSPLDAVICVKCREPFEGAAARKHAREEERKRQEYMRLASQGMNAAVQVATSPTGERVFSSLLGILTK